MSMMPCFSLLLLSRGSREVERRVKEMWFGIGSARDRRTLEFENSVFDSVVDDGWVMVAMMLWLEICGREC